jgi:hypothetical protein
MDYFKEYNELMKSKNVEFTDELSDKYRSLLRLLDTYSLLYEQYIKAFNEKNKEVVTEKQDDLYNIVLNIIRVINENKVEFYLIRSLAAFREIDELISGYKILLKHNDDILTFRKCVNWIRRKY